MLDGKKVIFIHNPKSGGTSLGRFLNVKRRTHTFPKDTLREKYWVNSFSIVVVREPFERFLSCYYDKVLRPNDNGLTKRYGRIIKDLSPFEFLEVLIENPKHAGPQSNWTHFPSIAKPHADLILKFEEIAKWKEELLGLGLQVQDRSLSHHNKSERSTSNHLDRLNIGPEDFKLLQQNVQRVYANDYELYGYR